jgi:hypothetical protein
MKILRRTVAVVALAAVASGVVLLTIAGTSAKPATSRPVLAQAANPDWPVMY